jgi:hypothetical protein
MSPWTSQIRRLRSRSGSAVQAAIPGRDRMPRRRETVSPGRRSARVAPDQPGRGRTPVDGLLSIAWLVLVVVMALLLRFAAIIGFDLGPRWYERPPSV